MATLATPDDLNGTSDGTQAYDVTGAERVIIIQVNNGTAGTAGIDGIEISHDEENWALDTSLVIDANNDFTGDVDDGLLNAAGVEPATDLFNVWRGGPYDGPTWIRCTRNASINASTVAWQTGAPGVYLIAVGGNHAGGALTALV